MQKLEDDAESTTNDQDPNTGDDFDDVKVTIMAYVHASNLCSSVYP